MAKARENPGQSFRRHIVGKAQVCGTFKRGGSALVGAVVSGFEGFAEIIRAAPVGEIAKSPRNGGGIRAGMQLHDRFRREGLRREIGGLFRKNNPSEAQQQQGVGGDRVSKEA